MGMSHHGSHEQTQSELMQRFLSQVEKRVKREYPNGRVGATDDGALAIAVTADAAKGIVVIDFGKQVDWIGLPPSEVAALCSLLMRRAREIAKEPLVVEV
jgi:hypothetical protein